VGRNLSVCLSVCVVDFLGGAIVGSCISCCLSPICLENWDFCQTLKFVIYSTAPAVACMSPSIHLKCLAHAHKSELSPGY
jgi:hypothetical protein